MSLIDGSVELSQLVLPALSGRSLACITSAVQAMHVRKGDASPQCIRSLVGGFVTGAKRLCLFARATMCSDIDQAMLSQSTKTRDNAETAEDTAVG